MKIFFIHIGLFILMLFLLLMCEITYDLIIIFIGGNRDAKIINGKFLVRYKFMIPILSFIIGLVLSISFIIPSFVAKTEFSVKATLLSFGIVFLIATILLVHTSAYRRIAVSQDCIKVYYVFHLPKTILYDQIVSAEYNENILQLKLLFENGLKFTADDDMIGLRQLYDLIQLKRPEICSTIGDDNVIKIDLDKLL